MCLGEPSLTPADAPPSDILGMSHVLLGLPLIRLHPSFYSTGPVFVSHYYDVQSQTDWANLWHSTWSKLEDEVERIEGKGADTTEEKKRAHVGPPASNVEVVLRGVGQGWDAQDGAGAGAGAGTKTKGGKDAPIKGEVWVRGPGVVSRLGKETADG
jgi:long-chain acyl-CoA synthetase